MEDVFERTEYGYLALKNKPTRTELEHYYAEKYYQQAQDRYEQSYTDEEIIYFNNKIEQKYFAAKKLTGADGEKSLIDIGCGEGWTLNYFNKLGWTVKGLDYSSFGCEKFNPHCKEFLVVGDIYENLSKVTYNKEKFSIVWLDNVLEHVIDPLNLLTIARELVDTDGVIIVEVPNDFSDLQQYLLDNKLVDKPFWVAIPDHISYFNKEGLLNLASAASLYPAFLMADFPIDINLLNPLTNYYHDKKNGKPCYQTKIRFENFIHNISIEKTNELYSAMMNLGLGRQIIAFFKTTGNAGK